MENKDNRILSEQTVDKVYQIPKLVDLNGIGEAMGTPPGCVSGSSDLTSCYNGGNFQLLLAYFKRINSFIRLKIKKISI